MTLGEICPKTEKEKKKKFQEEKKSTTDTLRFCGCCPAGWVGGGLGGAETVNKNWDHASKKLHMRGVKGLK